MTQVLEKLGVMVCIVSVDSPYGQGAELKREFITYKNKSLAELFAGKFASQIQKRHPGSTMRGVFVQDGNNWKTVGSYFDV